MEHENKETRENINTIKNLCFKKINQIEKPTVKIMTIKIRHKLPIPEMKRGT